MNVVDILFLSWHTCIIKSGNFRYQCSLKTDVLQKWNFTFNLLNILPDAYYSHFTL